MKKNKSHNPSARIYFGKNASTYDSVRNANPVTEQDTHFIKQFIATIPINATLLDIPCGTGRVIEIMNGTLISYFGVDISEDMLSIARNKIGTIGDYSFEIGDAKNLKYEDKFFDHLVCVKFLKWLRNDSELLTVLKEFNRLTRTSALLNIKIRPEQVNIDMRELKDKLKDTSDFLKYGTFARGIKKQNFESLLKKSRWEIQSCEPNKASNGFVFNYIVKPM